jgi:hypothetical protein
VSLETAIFYPDVMKLVREWLENIVSTAAEAVRSRITRFGVTDQKRNANARAVAVALASLLKRANKRQIPCLGAPTTRRGYEGGEVGTLVSGPREDSGV